MSAGFEDNEILPDLFPIGISIRLTQHISKDKNGALNRKLIITRLADGSWFRGGGLYE